MLYQKNSRFTKKPANRCLSNVVHNMQIYYYYYTPVWFHSLYNMTLSLFESEHSMNTKENLEISVGLPLF